MCKISNTLSGNSPRPRPQPRLPPSSRSSARAVPNLLREVKKLQGLIHVDHTHGTSPRGPGIKVRETKELHLAPFTTVHTAQGTTALTHFLVARKVASFEGSPEQERAAWQVPAAGLAAPPLGPSESMDCTKGEVFVVERCHVSSRQAPAKGSQHRPGLEQGCALAAEKHLFLQNQLRPHGGVWWRGGIRAGPSGARAASAAPWA